MAGGAFDPAEFAAFKGAPTTAPQPPAGGFDPAEFAAFKGAAAAPAAPAPSEADRALQALTPFFEKGVSTRNSAGQWTGEARALLSKEGINPDGIDQKAEREILAQYQGKTAPTGDGAAAIGRGIINGVPVVGPALLGGTNKALAFVRSIQNRTPYSDELRNVEAFGENTARANPGATGTGEFVGGALGTAPLVMAAPAAFGAGGGSMLARSAISGGTSAAIGGADAAARNEGDLDAVKMGAGIGGLLGAAAPGVGAGVGRLAEAVASRIKPGAAAPSIADLKDTARAAYQRADDAGVQVAQDSFAGTVKNIAAEMKDAGLDRTIHPKATAALERLTGTAGTEPTLKELELLRRVAKGAAGSIEPDEKRLAKLMVDKLDDYVGTLGADDLVSGDAKAATEALSEARKFWGRARRAQTLEDAVESADLRAASTGSGGNANNATRQAIRRILDNPKLSAGYSAEEKEQMEAIIRGSGMQNALRLIGKLSPSGNGLMAALGIGATAANPMMAIAPVAGMAAKKVADRGTTQGVARLSEFVRAGGAPAPSPLALPARENAEELARLLTAQVPLFAERQLIGR